MLTRRLAALMFSDIVGFTALMQADEEAGRQKARHYRIVLQEKVSAYGGEVLRHYGDGSLSLFPSAVEALRAAREIQLALRTEPCIPLRIGLHLGDIAIEDDDLYGDGVNIASRVESMGVAGAVLFTARIMDDIRSHPEFKALSLGAFAFKNVAQPMEVFALADEGFPVPKPGEIGGKVKAMAPAAPKSLRWIRLAGLGFAAMAIGAMLFWTLLSTRQAGEGELLPEDIREEKVAVSVFDNFTGDDDLDALGFLASEWIGSGLRELKIKTVSPEMVRQYRDLVGILPGNPESKPSFAEVTGARYVITGSYFLQGDSLVLHTRLASAETGEELQAFPKLTGHKNSKEQLVEEARQYLLGYWVLKRDQQLPKINPPKYEAYQAYLKCKPGEFACYLSCVQLDPEFLLSRIFLMYNSALWDEDSLYYENKRFVERNWEKCTKYERNNFWYGLFQWEGNYEEAFAAVEANYHLDPDDLIMLHESAYFASCELNRPEFAVERYERLFEKMTILEDKIWDGNLYHYLDALNRLKAYEKASRFFFALPEAVKKRAGLETLSEVMVALIHQERFEEVKKLIAWQGDDPQAHLRAVYAFKYIYPNTDPNPFTEGLRSKLTEFEDPNHDWYYFSINGNYINWVSRVTALYVLEEWEKTALLLQQLKQFDWQAYYGKSSLIQYQHPLWIAGLLGCIYAHQDKREAAMAQIEEIRLMEKDYNNKHHSPFTKGAIPYLQARIYAILGEKETAAALLGESIKQGRVFIWWNIYRDLDFLSLKGYAPFEELIRPKG